MAQLAQQRSTLAERKAYNAWAALRRYLAANAVRPARARGEPPTGIFVLEHSMHMHDAKSGGGAAPAACRDLLCARCDRRAGSRSRPPLGAPHLHHPPVGRGRRRAHLRQGVSPRVARARARLGPLHPILCYAILSYILS